MQNMIKISTLAIGFIILAMACSNQFNKSNTMANDTIHIENMKYKIVITNYYFGRKQYITTVTQDSLLTQLDNFNDDKTSENRSLTKKEKEMLGEFLIKFPLAELKKQYVTEAVEDGTVMDFSITINNLHKDIYVSNMYQKDLGALVEVIVKLLKEDYIGYNTNSVPYKE